MTVTIQIENKTATGKRLIAELRQYPDVVRFIESEDENESLSVNDSAKLAFKRLGEKYDCKFDNKYTR